MIEKKKIGLKKQDFKWGLTEDSKSSDDGASSKKDVSLSAMIDTVNQELPEVELSQIAMDRKSQRVSISSAVDMIPKSLKNEELGISDVSKNRNQEKEKYIDAIESIDSSVESDEKTKKEIEDESFKLNKKVVINKNEVQDFKTNIKDMWKSILGIAILLITIVIAISYKDNGVHIEKNSVPQSTKIEKTSSSDSQLILESNIESKNFKSIKKEDVPTSKFEEDTKTVPVIKSKNLSLLSVLPTQGSKIFKNISLPQWPNATKLKEFPKDIIEITSIFPEHLYKKSLDFKESLVIFDGRSVEQEKFVRQGQNCYYFPDESNGSWMGLNYYAISYCFINNQFIGLNLYTSNGSDVIKKIENLVSKYGYLHISSVRKENGFNIVNIEQNQAYNILEEYRIKLLNNVLSKK